MDKLEYPIQILDAIRDIILNLIWKLLWAKGGSSETIRTFYMTFFKTIVQPQVTDQKLLKSFQKAGIVPTAWASRIARVKAIASAQKNVIIDAESIACFLHTKEDDWEKQGASVIDTLNAQAGLSDKDKWDGVIWPFGQ